MPIEQFLGLLLSIVVSAVGLGWFLRGKFDTMDQQLTEVGGRIERLRENLEERLRALRTDLEGQIGRLRGDLEGQIERLRGDLEGQIERLRENLEERLRALRADLEGQIERLGGDLEGQIGRLGRQMEGELVTLRVDLRDLAVGLKGLLNTMRTHQELLAVVFGSLQKAGALSPAETREIVKIQSGVLPRGLDTVIERMMRAANPFTSEEGERLKGYIRRAREGDLFSQEEARDFFMLSDRLAQEVPEEAGVWSLLTLAGFLVGLSLSAKEG